MVELLAIAERILAAILNALALLGIVQGQTRQAAVESKPFIIETIAANATNAIDNPSTGLAAIAARLDALTDNGAHTLEEILTALGAPQQTDVPVTLPTVAPSGYGGATSDQAASAVWEYISTYNTRSMDHNLALSGGIAYLFNSYGNVAALGNPAMSIVWGGAESSAWPSGSVGDLEKLFQDVTPDATRLANVERVMPDWTWFENPDGLIQGTPPVGSQVNFNLWVGITEAQFQALKAGAISPPSAAPVWPGLAGVTLGTPVDLTESAVVTGPMDGILVEITSTPPQLMYWTFVGTKSYRNAGAIAFTSDNGQEEYPILLGLADGVYTPRTMARAASVIVRLTANVHVTVTPWTIAS